MPLSNQSCKATDVLISPGPTRGKKKSPLSPSAAKRPTFQRVVATDFLQHSRTVVEMIGPAYGTQGYAITLAGARAFVDECRVIVRPIDDAMDRSWAHGVRNLALFPAPILEATVPSAIGTARFAGKNDPAFHTLRQRAWRQLERTRMRMMKARRFLGY